VGDHGSLFIDEDIRFYNLPAPVSAEAYRSKLELFARLQRHMAAKGQALIPVIIPSKTSLHEDELPAGLRARIPGQTRPGDATYRALRDSLDAASVRVVDARVSLAGMRERGIRAFPREGRHLSRPAACEVAMQIGRAGGGVLGMRLDWPSCEPTELVPAGVQDDDFDLWRLLNVWRRKGQKFDRVFQERTAPFVRPPIDSPILLVGSSFNWNILAALLRWRVTEGVHLWYYNVTYYDKGGPERKLVPLDAAWRQVIAESRIIAVDIPEMFLPGFGHGFLEQLAEAEGLLP
jgi:hypothetical protein